MLLPVISPTFTPAANIISTDNTTNYYSKSSGLDNIGTSSAFTLIFYSPGFGTEGTEIININNGKFVVTKSGFNISITAFDSSSTTILSTSCASFFLSGTPAWYFISCNLGGSVEAYRSSGGVLGFTTPTSITGSIDLGGVGASSLWGISSGDVCSGDLYNFWFDTSYRDVTNSSVRLPFLPSPPNTGSWGEQGEVPTGTQPLIYINGYQQHLNTGRGGVFTYNGALTQGASAPLVA